MSSSTAICLILLWQLASKKCLRIQHHHGLVSQLLTLLYLERQRLEVFWLHAELHKCWFIERNPFFLKVPFRIIWMHLKSCHDSSKKLLFFLTYSKCRFLYSKHAVYMTRAVKEAKEVRQSLFDARCKKVGMLKKYGLQGLLSCRPPPDVMFQKSMTEEAGQNFFPLSPFVRGFAIEAGICMRMCTLYFLRMPQQIVKIQKK